MPRDARCRTGSAIVWSALWLVAACGTDVAQTAVVIETPGLVDCSAPGALALPQDTTFGDGTEPQSALVGTGYAAGLGPGLYVTARDAFRVYLNGQLVVASSAPRKALFVPLTLLPGANAISVVVAAKEGTPAALVQVDELERSYLSDATWKVSTAPTRGYASADYDDSAWPVATDLGAIGTLGACEPGSAFPAASSARWIGPKLDSGATAVLRKVINVAPVGYGAATTGGRGAQPVFVNDWEDLVALASDADAPQVIALSEGVHDFRTAPRDLSDCVHERHQ